MLLAREDPVTGIQRHLSAISASLDHSRRELQRRALVRDLLAITAGDPKAEDMVLDFALTYAMENGQLAEGGSIFVNVPAGPTQVLRLLLKKVFTAERRVQKIVEADEFQEFKEGEGIAGHVLSTRDSIIANDPLADSRYLRFKETDDLRAIAAVPVKCGQDVLAVICLHNRDRTTGFSDADEEFLRDLANVSALCIRAYHNDLTMLPSRPLMNELLRQEANRASKADSPLTLMYLDIDNFGKINRDLGHDVGDNMIVELATLLREHTSDTILCHRHGDEFAIICPNYDSNQAGALAERIRESVSAKHSRRELLQTISVSGG